MARWRLLKTHYLDVPGTEWEYKEVSQATGKQFRKVHPVNAYLNPDDPSDCNYPGECVVAHAGKGLSKDIIFIGDPTPEMEPIDDEAKKITEELQPKWKASHPIDSLPGEFGQSMLTYLDKQLTEAMAKSGPLPPYDPSRITVSKNEFDELKVIVQRLDAENKALKSKLEPIKKA